VTSPGKLVSPTRDQVTESWEGAPVMVQVRVAGSPSFTLAPSPEMSGEECRYNARKKVTIFESQRITVSHQGLVLRKTRLH
jgi:hypothetical protein